MTVVVYELNSEDEFEELGRSSGEGTDEELLGIYPEEVWEEESDKWLVERLDGPYVIGEIEEEGVDNKRLEKFWTEYRGPHGGEGWQNLMTGEVRYVDEKPSEGDDYDHGEEVREPDSDSEFSTFEGISDASLIRDNMPVTTKFTNDDGETQYGEIVRADVGGYRSRFVIAAADGKHYHAEADQIEGYIEPEPEWNPNSDNEDQMWQSQFEEVEVELGEENIPPVPSRNMGIGGDTPMEDEFNHIGDTKITDEHVQNLQDTIRTGDLGPISVDFMRTGDSVEYGPWDKDITDWFDGGQFAHVDVEMTPEDFLATQATMLANDRDHPVQAHRSFYGSARPDDVRDYAEVLEDEPGEMPMPYIEMGRDGRMRNYQEGRHRALAALYAGHETLPVRMVINAEREGKAEEDYVQWPREEEKTIEKDWIPYQGPQGGEGWQNTEDPKDIRYQQDPPGKVAQGYESIAEDWGENEADEQTVEIPEKFEGEYVPGEISPMDDLGEPSKWDGEFGFSPGQTLLGNAWEWTVDNVWFRNDEWTDGDEGLPAFRAEIPNGVAHTFRYMDGEKVEALGLDPGWYQSRSGPPRESERTEFVGVVGEPKPYEFRFDPDPEVVEENPFDMEEAAERLAEGIEQNRYDSTGAYNVAAELIENKDATFDGLVEMAEHALEAKGESVDTDRDITEAENIALNGVKMYLDNQAKNHPEHRGKLSLGHVDRKFQHSFERHLTSEAEDVVEDAMRSWVNGIGSMVNEDTIPVYNLADEKYENDFYPTRDDVSELIEESDNLKERKDSYREYREKTVEAFREQFGDTIPVFRGYNPAEYSKGADAREALQSEDSPSTIEIRNGVANSWATDPTVAYQFSQWTNDDRPGIIVRRELPVEQIFGASDTTPELSERETEIIAGNPDEVSEHDRDDVFLPEEFDALEQAKWALEQVQGEADADEEKSEGDTLHLDWELSSVGWMNEERALEEALLSKGWLPLDTDDRYEYQHIESGERVVSNNFGYSKTAAKAGYRPAMKILAKDRLSKEWIPYRGPQGGEGWQNVNNSGDIRYQEDPPGKVAEGYEEYAEGWGTSSAAERDKIQGASVINYDVQGTDQDLRIPRNFTREDLEGALQQFDNDHKGTLKDELTTTMIRDSDLSWDDDTDVLRAAAHVLQHHPDKIDGFNGVLHEEIRDNPNADFDTPFGMKGSEAHNLLEDTFGPHSDIVSDLENSILFDDSVDEDNAEAWVVGAQQWIRENGDRKMADEFEAALNDTRSTNPFKDVDADIPDGMDPAEAERVSPLWETTADTGISAESMFIAEFEDGSRAFVTNLNWQRAQELDDVKAETEKDGQRVMAGYQSFRIADMEVPHHELVEGEYWVVEEAPGVPAKEWNGNPDNIDREQFHKLGAVGILSGNWDLHGGNVFVGPEGDLIPVDLDLAGHKMVDNGSWKPNSLTTAWGRLERLGHTLDIYDRFDDSERAELKRGIVRKTEELVEDGTADEIKSLASRIENADIQINIEENVFAAKDGSLYDMEVGE